MVIYENIKDTESTIEGNFKKKDENHCMTIQKKHLSH